MVSVERVAVSGPDPTPGRPRLIDSLLFGYFGVNTLLLLHPNRPANWPGLLAFHLVYLIGIPLLVRFGQRHWFVARVRDWYPLAGLIVMYNELQYLNRVLTDRYFDDLIQRWEIALFGSQLAVSLRQWFPWKWLGEAAHFGYFTYYFITPSLLIPLWAQKKRTEFRVATGVIGMTYVFCYLFYVYFPVTGPYWQFPFPDPAAEGWFFPQLMNKIVAGGSSRGSAFPSSHIAATVTGLALAWRYQRTVFTIILLPVILLTIGTMYGGFHYGVDALGGVVAGLFFGVLGPRILAAAGETVAVTGEGAAPRTG